MIIIDEEVPVTEDMWKYIDTKLMKQPKCKICWDKGFSTRYVGPSYAMPDFIGDRKYLVDKGGVKIKYCTCDKGKRLKFRNK